VAEDVETVVDRGDDSVAAADDTCTVVESAGAGAGLEAAAVEPGMTGRRALSRPGVQTLMRRQSSVIAVPAGPAIRALAGSGRHNRMHLMPGRSGGAQAA
jgi:hypothetical protein